MIYLGISDRIKGMEFETLSDYLAVLNGLSIKLITKEHLTFHENTVSYLGHNVITKVDKTIDFDKTYEVGDNKTFRIRVAHACVDEIERVHVMLDSDNGYRKDIVIDGIVIEDEGKPLVR